MKTSLTKVTKSTNFTLQSALLLVFAFAELIGFPVELAEEMVQFIEATALIVIGFWGQIRAFIQRGIKFQYTGNVLTYIFAFAGGFVEWISSYDLEGAIGGLIDALTSGNLNLLLPAVFALGNILIRLINDKPWQSGDEPAPSLGA